jgi:hypothetical protein
VSFEGASASTSSHKRVRSRMAFLSFLLLLANSLYSIASVSEIPTICIPAKRTAPGSSIKKGPSTLRPLSLQKPVRFVFPFLLLVSFLNLLFFSLWSPP